MNCAARSNKNQRSKMTYKGFCRGVGYRYTPRNELTDATQKLQERPLQFAARSPQMGPRRYVASRELFAQGIGLQRRYPIWGLRACPKNHDILRCHFAVRQRMPKSFNLLVSFSHEATGREEAWRQSGPPPLALWS